MVMKDKKNIIYIISIAHAVFHCRKEHGFDYILLFHSCPELLLQGFKYFTIKVNSNF
jgi:uncharacterized membrane protein